MSIEKGRTTCWRYGRKGSLAVHVGGPDGLVGTWTDFESGDHGGVLELIERERQCDRAEAMTWLEREELISLAADRRSSTRFANRTRGTPRPTRRGSQDSTSALARNEKDRQEIGFAGRLWAEAVSADDDPGRVYLSRRWVWPAVNVDRAPPLPLEAVRWLSRKAAAKITDPRTGKGLWLPKTAAGALVFAFTLANGDLVAVQLEALTEAGDRTPWTNRDQRRFERYRQDRGRKAGGAYMRLGAAGEGALVIVEGPTDALSAWWLWPNSTAVWSCAGTSGLRHLQPEYVASFDLVRLAADGDAAGQTATWQAAERLVAAGVSVRRWKIGCGADPVDRLTERLVESASKLEYDGGLSRAEAEAAAWSPYLTQRGNGNDRP